MFSFGGWIPRNAIEGYRGKYQTLPKVGEPTYTLVTVYESYFCSTFSPNLVLPILAIMVDL